MPSTLRIACAIIDVTKENWFQEKHLSCQSRVHPAGRELINHPPTKSLGVPLGRPDTKPLSK